MERELLVGFCEEVSGYLPIIHEALRATDRPEGRERLEEAHRYVHTIKGAAAMIGLTALSELADRMESTLDQLTHGELPLLPRVTQLLERSTDAIAGYLEGQFNDPPDSDEAIQALTAEYTEFSKPPEPPPPPPAHNDWGDWGWDMPLSNDPPAQATDLPPAEPTIPPPLSEEPSKESPDSSDREPATLAQAADESPETQESSQNSMDFSDFLNTADPPLAPVASNDDFGFDDMLSQLSPESPTDPLDQPELSAADDFGDLNDRLVPLMEPSAEGPKFNDSSPSRATTVPAGAMLAPSNDVPAELRDIFLLEAEDHLRIIASLLPDLEREANNPEHIRAIRRSAHTLKGSAALVGFTAVNKLAHRMEDLLDLIAEGQRSAGPDEIRLLFASADALEDLARGSADAVKIAGLYEQYDLLLGQPKAPTAGRLSVPTMVGQSVAPAAATETEPEEPTEPQRKKSGGRFVRVPVERLDDIVKLVSELVIARTSFEQRLSDLQRQLEELRGSADRLRLLSGRLESQYEVKALIRGRIASDSTSISTNIAAGFDELEMDRYSEFHLLSRAMAETTSDVQSIGTEIGHLAGDFESYLNRESRLTSEVEDKLRRLRMVPLSSIVAKLQRTVRNAADTAKKQAELVIEGETTELDKNVLEELSDPLLHLLRNAVDHGLESPEERQAKGKPTVGVIRLRAFSSGSQVVVQVGDDGRGIDVEAVRESAVRKGLIREDQAPNMEANAVLALLFHAGFSTASKVSELSGRGVGLDVVKTQVQKLKGTLSVDPRPGLGALFTIRLPLTLAITRALMVKSGRETFALPLESILQIRRLEDSTAQTLGNSAVITIDHVTYPLYDLAQVLGLRSGEEAISRPPVLILRAGDEEIALRVDHLFGGREIVIKSLGTHLKRVSGVSGATLLGDGTVVLILNPDELVQTFKFDQVADSATSRLAALEARSSKIDQDALRVMVVDDSPSVRRVVSMLLQRTGWQALTAKDGVEALELLHSATDLPDAILSDVEMPRMDGFEFLQSMRAEPSFRPIPVVMVTSRVSDKHRRKAIELGAAGYLTKPFQDEELLGTVRRLVRSARGVRAN